MTAWTEHGTRFPAAIARGSLLGVQFHPERSGSDGLRLLANFTAIAVRSRDPERGLMLSRRVIPCLDVADGRVVKGTHFVDLVDAGDPVELAGRYAAEGADELVYLDISAAAEGRGTLLELVERTARTVFIPLTVGGGVRAVSEMRDVLRAGADKVSLNTAAVDDPTLINRCATRFGRQAVVVAIDAARDARRSPGWPGPGAAAHRTGLDALAWAERAVELGAGELLVTSIDRDGTGSGFDTELLRAISDHVPVPVIASGGAAGPADFVRAIRDGHADAVLAASIFHRRIASIARGQGRDGRGRTAGPARDRARGMSLDPNRLELAGRPGPAAGDRPGSGRRPRPDDGLDGPRGTRSHRWRPARSISTRGRATGSGARARRAATSSTSSRSSSTATATRSSSGWIRPARPATAAPGAASTRKAPSAGAGPGPGLRLARDALGDDRRPGDGRRPSGSYTAKLLDGGVDAAGRKVTEEATEVLIAAKDDAAAQATGDAARPNGERRSAGEAADLVFHTAGPARRARPASRPPCIEVLRARHGPGYEARRLATIR